MRRPDAGLLDRAPLAVFAGREERIVSCNATEAHQQFFALLSEVVADPSEVVLIEHKGLPQRGMLVGEGYRTYVRQLEQLVRAFASSVRPPAASFRLAGTMTLPGELEPALDDLRADAHAAFARKIDDL